MPARPDQIALAHALLDGLGVTVADLRAVPGLRAGPTVAEFYVVVRGLASEALVRSYDLHWRRLVAAHGDERLDEVLPSDVRALVGVARDRALTRGNAKGGRTAMEHCVGAVRHFFARAVDDGHATANPGLSVAKPRRLPPDRRPLTDAEVAELRAATVGGGDDPALDGLVFAFHLQTGARRGGGLALRVRDVDRRDQMVLLREKAGSTRRVPVSGTLAGALLDHAAGRGVTDRDEPLFRLRPIGGQTAGGPMGRRRYDQTHAQWRREVGWAAERHVSCHWLRHTAIARVERAGGFAAARRFAGHADESGSATLTYLRGGDVDVARAVATITGEPHPLLG